MQCGLLPGSNSSQPRTLNRLVAQAMENLAARAAAIAAPTSVARSQEARGDRNDAAGDEGNDDCNESVASDEDSAILSEQAPSPPTSEYVPSDRNLSEETKWA
jgi:hypothetical protein